MKEETNRWLEMAEYDLDTAEAMFRARRYIYVVFMCHLCLEKMLKGYVIEFVDSFPPYTHNLIRLAQLVKLQLPEELQKFIIKLSDQSIITRYPESLKQYTRAHAQDYLEQTKRVFSWLRQRLTSNI